MKQNKIAIIYDFDGTLTPKTMQEYTLLPKLGINPNMFWKNIIRCCINCRCFYTIVYSSGDDPWNNTIQARR